MLAAMYYLAARVVPCQCHNHAIGGLLASSSLRRARPKIGDKTSNKAPFNVLATQLSAQAAIHLVYSRHLCNQASHCNKVPILRGVGVAVNVGIAVRLASQLVSLWAFGRLWGLLAGCNTACVCQLLRTITPPSQPTQPATPRSAIPASAEF